MGRNAEKSASVAAYFDRYARTWQANYDVGRDMQARREQFSRALSARIRPGAAVLDFGCGPGDVTEACAQAGFVTTGCDISRRMIDQARLRFGDHAGQRFVWLDPTGAPDLPFEDTAFSAVIASSVFEYIDDPVPQFREIARVLRPGGWLLFTIPDTRHPARIAEQKVLDRYARGPRAWALVLLPRWSKLRTRLDYLRMSRKRAQTSQWIQWLEHAGFEPEPIAACEAALLLLAARRHTSDR